MFIGFRERGGGGGEGRRDRNISPIAYWLPPICALTRDWTCNLLFYRSTFHLRQGPGYTTTLKSAIYNSIFCVSEVDQGLSAQPRHVPWPGLKPLIFWCTGRCSTQLSHTGKGQSCVFKDKETKLCSKWKAPPMTISHQSLDKVQRHQTEKNPCLPAG